MRKLLLFIILLFFSFKSYSQTMDQAYTYIQSRAVYYFGSNYKSQAQISLEGNIFKIFNMNTGSYLSGVTAMFSTIDSCTYISSRTGLTVNSQRYYDSSSGGSMVCAEICLSGSFSAPGTCVYPPVTCPDGSKAANLSACPIQCTLPALRDSVTNTCHTAVCSYPSFLNQSTGLCNSASSCSVLQYFNSETGQCQDSQRECGSLHYNRSTGTCDTPSDCSVFANTILDPVSNTCVFDPNSCGSTEYVDYSTNRCALRNLVCPAGSHTHASPTNDSCLPDAPVTCPAGQHDPGTYSCVANNSQSCAAGQSSGLVNGVLQCVNTGNSTQNNQAANDAGVAAKAAQDAAITAKNQYDAAVVAANNAAALANANPTSIDLANAALSANQNAENAHTALDAANLAAANAQKNADDLSKIAQQDTLRSVDDSLKSLDKYNKDKSATAGDGSCSSPPSCSGDPIACSQLTTQYQLSCHGDAATQDMADESLGGKTLESSDDVGLASLDSSGFGLSTSCPAPREFVVLGKSFNFSYDGFCSLASVIGNLLMITASFIALRILVSS